MAKSVVIIIFIILALLLGFTCTGRVTPVIRSVERLGIADSNTQDIKYSLPELEEPVKGYNYQEVIDKYSSRIPENFSITKFKQFVIFSGLDPKVTYSVIDNDIRTTIDAMTNSYVEKIPDSVTAFFLFKDHDSYKDFTLNNTNIEEKDLSQYGYFKISLNIIAIRYVDWKGSPRHEVTHRFTRSDFPGMPSWLDEGLAALNEKSVYKDGKLIGEFSLRILAIRRAIKEDRYTGLENLMKTDDNEFYDKYSPFYYAQSRFLLMYLQEKGLLEKYYKSVRDTFKQDKTGISQLEKILGKSIDDIDGDYYKYITSFKE
jgi:hypothetical protein